MPVPAAGVPGSHKGVLLAIHMVEPVVANNGGL